MRHSRMLSRARSCKNFKVYGFKFEKVRFPEGYLCPLFVELLLGVHVLEDLAQLLVLPPHQLRLVPRRAQL